MQKKLKEETEPDLKTLDEAIRQCKRSAEEVKIEKEKFRVSVERFDAKYQDMVRAEEDMERVILCMKKKTTIG